MIVRGLAIMPDRWPVPAKFASRHVGYSDSQLTISPLGHSRPALSDFGEGITPDERSLLYRATICKTREQDVADGV